MVAEYNPDDIWGTSKESGGYDPDSIWGNTPAPEPEPPKEDASSVGGMFHRFLEGMADPIYGASQFLENTVESVAPSVVDAVGDADAWLYDKTGGFLGKPAGVDVDEQLRRREQEYEDTYDVDGIDWMRGAGNVATGVALAPTIAAGASLPATAGILAAEGAAGGAFMPQVGEGDYWGQVGEDALVGALAGGIGGTALHKGGQALTSQLNRPGMGVLKEAGVQPTVGQAVGGAADTLEQKLGSIPFVGDLVNHARGRAQAELRDAALQRVVAPIGETITETGADGIAQAHRAVGKAYDAARDMLPSIKVSDDIVKQFDDMAYDFTNRGYSESAQKAYDRVMKDSVLGRLGGAGEISSEAFKRMDSDLSNKIAKANPELKEMLTETRRLLMDTAADQSPEYASQLAKADEAFKNLAVVDRAGARAEEFTPKQLEAAIKANDTTARKNAFAQGKGPMRDLSKAGADILSNTVADSGTVGRALTAATAIGGGYYNPAIIAPLAAATAAGAVGSTRIGQKGIIGLLDILAKGGEKVGQEGLVAGGLLSQLMGDE